MKPALRLAASITICLIAGAIGSAFTFPSIPTWYAGLYKPFFNPPNWVFGPAWTILYILMGLALYLFLEKAKEKRLARKGIMVFGTQLSLNALWSIIFFGLHRPFSAFIAIVLLWLLIAYSILVFSRASKRAAWLLVPYLAWVSFASILNFSVWLLNP